MWRSLQLQQPLKGRPQRRNLYESKILDQLRSSNTCPPQPLKPLRDWKLWVGEVSREGGGEEGDRPCCFGQNVIRLQGRVQETKVCKFWRQVIILTLFFYDLIFYLLFLHLRVILPLQPPGSLQERMWSLLSVVQQPWENFGREDFHRRESHDHWGGNPPGDRRDGGKGYWRFDHSTDRVNSRGHQCPIKITNCLITWGGRKIIGRRLWSGPPQRRGYGGRTSKAPRYELHAERRRRRSRPLFSGVLWTSGNQVFIL